MSFGTFPLAPPSARAPFPRRSVVIVSLACALAAAVALARPARMAASSSLVATRPPLAVGSSSSGDDDSACVTTNDCSQGYRCNSESVCVIFDSDDDGDDDAAASASADDAAADDDVVGTACATSDDCPTGYRCNSNLECIGLSGDDDDGDDGDDDAAAAASAADDDDADDDDAAAAASADDGDDDAASASADDAAADDDVVGTACATSDDCPTGYRCNSNLECIGLSGDDDGDDDASSAAADDAAADDAAAGASADDDDEDDAAAGTASADDDDDDDAAAGTASVDDDDDAAAAAGAASDDGDDDAFSGDDAAVDGDPHVVLVVIDDMGFNDIGYQSTDLGGAKSVESMTPVIDRLAASGVKLDWYIYTPRRGRALLATLLRVTVRSPFLRYYSAATCTPARGALMTGLHWARLGLWWSNIEATSPWAMPLSTPTLASRLRERGYATHLVGKWDIGHCNRSHWPTARGFETFYGLLGPEYANYTSHAVYTLDATDDDEIAGALAGWSGASAVTIRDLVDARAVEGASAQRFSFDDADEYSTSLFAARAAKIIGEHRASASLFLTLAFNAVHNIVSTPRGFGATDAGKRAHKETKHSGDASLRETFAGALALVDDGVDTVYEALRSSGLYNRTVLIVVSDNGGMVKNGGNNYPLRGEKATFWEGGYRVPAFVHSALLPRSAHGAVCRALVHATDWAPTLLAGLLASPDSVGETDGVDQWATLMSGCASDGPRTEVLHDIYYVKREHKHDVYQSWASGAIRWHDLKLITHTERCKICPPSEARLRAPSPRAVSARSRAVRARARPRPRRRRVDDPAHPPHFASPPSNRRNASATSTASATTSSTSRPTRPSR